MPDDSQDGLGPHTDLPGAVSLTPTEGVDDRPARARGSRGIIVLVAALALAASLGAGVALIVASRTGNGAESEADRKATCERIVSSLTDPLKGAVDQTTPTLDSITTNMDKFADASAAVDQDEVTSNRCALVAPYRELGRVEVALLGTMGQVCTPANLNGTACTMARTQVADLSSLLRNTIHEEESKDELGTETLPASLAGYDKIQAALSNE